MPPGGMENRPKAITILRLTPGSLASQSAMPSMKFFRAGDFEDVALQRDAIVAVDKGSYKGRAGVLVVHLFSAAAEIGIEQLVLITVVGAHPGEGLFVRLVPLPRPLLTLLARSGRRVVHAEFIDDDPVQEGSLVEKAGPKLEMFVGRFGLAVD